MGRIAADLRDDGVERVYVPGTEHIFRLWVDGDQLRIDTWHPRYRWAGGPYGLAWDSCLSAGSCWIMDCGDIDSVRRIHTTEPNGRFAEPPGRLLSWRRPAPWSGAQRLLRISVDDADDISSIEPFGAPGGGIIAPPVHLAGRHRAIAWDSINGGLAGIDTSGTELATIWQLSVRPSMQPAVFPDTGELVINDFTDAGDDDLVVVDVETGELLDRVATGCRVANGMFLTPGGDRDVFYCSTTTVSHVRWS